MHTRGVIIVWTVLIVALAAPIAHADLISREEDWDGASTPTTTNWDFYRYRDTTPADGWQTATGSLTPLVWDGTRFDINAGDPAVNQPYWSETVTGIGGSLANKTEWWAIAQWTSDQNALTLQAVLDSDYTTAINYIGGGNGQVVVAYHDVSEGTWSPLYNTTVPNGANIQVGGGAGQISNASFSMDSGDELRVALRIASTSWGQASDRGLDFTVVPEPSTLALFLAGFLCLFRLRVRS